MNLVKRRKRKMTKDFKIYDTYNDDFKSINDYPLSDEIKQFISDLRKKDEEELIKRFNIPTVLTRGKRVQLIKD
jgi:hypothetical protein